MFARKVNEREREKVHILERESESGRKRARVHVKQMIERYRERANIHLYDREIDTESWHICGLDWEKEMCISLRMSKY